MPCVDSLISETAWRRKIRVYDLRVAALSVLMLAWGCGLNSPALAQPPTTSPAQTIAQSPGTDGDFSDSAIPPGRHASDPPRDPAGMALRTSGRSTFRIGYVRQDPESPTTSGVFVRLVAFLNTQPEIRTQMARNGIRDITLQSFDSHRLLVEAMDAEQVDVAFCSVIDFAYQRGNYEPVYQLRRAGDPHSSTGGRRAWHSGVIFVNNRSRLFDLPTSAAQASLPAYVMDHEMAMVGSSSAAGYVYPYLALERLTTNVAVMNAPSVFWDSSSEVVKAVINGIHEVGACDATAIDEVLRAYGLERYRAQMIKEIVRTDPVPRDPVVIRSYWVTPDSGGIDVALSAEFGRRLIRAIGGFFQSDSTLPRLDRTQREAYQEVSENLQRFRQLRGQL